jgi:hypothetical protein
VLEVGSEELPPDDVLAGMAQLKWVQRPSFCRHYVIVILCSSCLR